MMSGKRAFKVATIAAVSSIDSVVWVTKASFEAFFGSNFFACSTVSIRITAPAGSWPSVPTTSG